MTRGPVGPLQADETGTLPATDAGCEEVAVRFRALSEPTRLKILRRLARGEASVGEIVTEVGGTQANVSKHLSVLHGSTLVDRHKEGARTVYRIADPTVLRICAMGTPCRCSIGRERPDP